MQHQPLGDASVDVRWFSVAAGGRAVSSDRLGAHTAEALLYVTRIADTIGYRLGAGPLTAIEAFGPSSAFAEVRGADDPESAVTLSGCVTPSRASSRQELEEWHRAGGRS